MTTFEGGGLHIVNWDRTKMIDSKNIQVKQHGQFEIHSSSIYSETCSQIFVHASNWKNENNLAYSLPRGFRLSASWDKSPEAPGTPRHYGSEGFKDLKPNKQ